MKKSLTILFSGGGSLGHVVPSVAVADEMKRTHPGHKVVFVCADRKEEKDLLTHAGYEHHVIRAPKSPPLFSWKTPAFPFRFLPALLRARRILSLVRPDIVFSKGGYASVPVCMIAKLRGIPIVLHESDSVMSRSSRIIGKKAVAICHGFPDPDLPKIFKAKAHHTGNPVRTDIIKGSKDAARRITGFSGRRPVLMIIGGSQGSQALNAAVHDHLGELVDLADIVHLTGVGKALTVSHARYFARPLVFDELPHLYALADIVLSRSSAGVLTELAILKKPVITVPLAGVAHDHQVRNAEILRMKHAVLHLRQQDLGTLPSVVKTLLKDAAERKTLAENLHRVFPADAAARILTILLAARTKRRIES